MFKVIKDNKIIGISKQEPVLLDSYDVEEDTEHSVDDYQRYNDEYLLKEDIPAPTVEEQNEQIRMQRQARYVAEADPLRYDYDEALARGEETAEEKKQAWLAKKDQIREELPYVSE